jgi:hypothetical protein
MSQAPPVAPPIPPSDAPPKKGIPPLAWVAIGCGGLLVIACGLFMIGGFFIFHKAKSFAAHPETAMARMITAGNPDLEVVTTDEDAKTITFRNKKTGEVVTINFEDAQKGKIVFKGDQGADAVIETTGEGQTAGIRVNSDKGSFTFGQGAGSAAAIPSWIPAWPGAKIQSTFTGNEASKSSGMYQFDAGVGVAQAMDFFEKGFKKAGFTISKSTYNLESDQGGGILTAKSGGLEANVTFTRQDGKTVVAVVYEEKK